MGRDRHGPRSTWAEIDMGRDQHGPKSMGRDRRGPRSTSTVVSLASKLF